MVRFLRSTCDDFETEEDLEKFLHTEKVFSVLFIVSSICLAIGILSGGGVIPYAARYEWRLLLISSAFLVVMNARDANYCVETFFSARSQSGKLAPLCANGKLHGSIEGQMHMFAALSMTMGSLSLLNASIIAILQQGAGGTCRKQYVVAFALHVVGSAANNVITDSTLKHAHDTRILLNFQHIVGSTALLISGILMLPDLAISNDNLFHRGVLITSTTLGSIMTVLAAVMHYFHSIAFSWMQREFYERRVYELQGLQTIEKQEQSASLQNIGYFGRLREAIKTKGRTLIWSGAVDARQMQVLSETSHGASEEELLTEQTYDDDLDEGSVTSVRSSSLGTDSSEGDTWLQNRVVRFGT